MINHFCDPCLQNYVTIDDRTETFSECMEWGLPSECPDAVFELLHFFDPVLFGEQ